MHIVDGALSNSVVAAGTILTIGGLYLGLKSLTIERIPAAGVLSASFFVASLIHVPIGPSSVHLIMNGLAGIILSWGAFPALFVGLLLQAVFFGFGGLTVLGVNTFNIAFPAVIVGIVLRRYCQMASPKQAALWGAVAGALAIALTTGCVALALAMTGEAFLAAAKLVFFAHIPVMAIEAALSAAALYQICQVRPDLLRQESVYVAK